ncbi:unnamed protein product, partial [Brassica rapa subsp. trilocularis]
ASSRSQNQPSVHKRNFTPGSFPNIPNIHRFPKIPGIQNIPQISIPNIPIPQIPVIPGLPNIPGLPRGSFGLFQSVLVSQSAEPENCLTGDKSKVGEKCLSQIFSSWAGNNFSLDKECCELVLNMDKKFRSSLFLASGGGLNLELSCG